MTCSSTFLKYPLAFLVQTPAAYILMYCNAFSATFTTARCFQLRKKVLRLEATSYQSSDGVFSHDVTAAILVSQNNETAAMLVSQTSPLGVELFSYAKAFFCSNKFAYMLATWVKTLYRTVQHLCLWLQNDHEWQFQFSGHHWHSSPLTEVRIPRRAAARAHFLVINKAVGQFYLSFNAR